MKVAVVGATGNVGDAVASALLATGHRVRAPRFGAWTSMCNAPNAAAETLARADFVVRGVRGPTRQQLPCRQLIGAGSGSSSSQWIPARFHV
jgi:uncharacterized protein YbjT (DUF2867 family)